MKALRIGIDGYNFAIPHGTGIASYGLMLAKTLATMGHQVDGLFGIDPGNDPSLHEVLFYERLAQAVPPARMSLPRRLATDLGWAKPQVVPIPSGSVETGAFAERLPAFRQIWTGARLFDAAMRRFRLTGKMTQISLPDPPDIMHWTYPVPLCVRGIPNIYTVHDLVPLKLPHTTLDRKPEFKALIDACTASAAQICTVSVASQHDIEDMFPQAAGMVTNTHQVSSLLDGEVFSVRPHDVAALQAFDLKPKGYFLFFGAIEPKKNIGRLLEAYLSLDTETPLVLVSSRSWQSDQELALLNRSAPAENGQRGKNGIVRINHVPRAILKGLIAQARAVLFPSLYEGFGLPAHEAMLMGTPVLTSDRGGLREVAGDAAILIDPYDVESIAEGLYRLDTDDSLREALAKAGKDHAARFSIEKYRTALGVLYTRAWGKHDAGSVERNVS
ncbi:glycosyltransferase family 4 protein [Novosphingobium panipatense]|uniref:glycosyltransferase family 4 protein n=1 Tax=Novosphingobium panipatense TaxID=428991 RepID=UPI0039A1C0EC